MRESAIGWWPFRFELTAIAPPLIPVYSPIMNKRKAVLAIFAAMPAMLARKAVAAQIEGLPVIAAADTSQRMVLTFDLKSFEKFEFFFGKEKITLSPAEIFSALKES